MHLWIKKFQLVIFILFYDVLSYHPSLGLINQVRFNFFSLPTKEAKFFLCFWQKVKYTFSVFLFVNRSTLFTIPTIFVGALKSLTSGEKQVKKFAKTSDQLVEFVFYKPRGQINSHAKCTVQVLTRFTSLLFAVRTSMAATTSKKVTMVTSTYNFPLLSLRWNLSRINNLDQYFLHWPMFSLVCPLRNQ